MVAWPWRHRSQPHALTSEASDIAGVGTSATRQAIERGAASTTIQPEPDAWRTFHDGHVDTILKPDLAIVITDDRYEHSWFVEVDLDTESRTVIERKCRTYTTYWRSGIEQARHGVFPQVLWIAPTQRRAEHIASTFTRTGIEARLRAAEAALARTEYTAEQIEATINNAVKLASSCHDSYVAGDENIRRQINQALFKRILVTEDGVVEWEYAEPIAMLMSAHGAAGPVNDGAARCTISQAVGAV